MRVWTKRRGEGFVSVDGYNPTESNCLATRCKGDWRGESSREILERGAQAVFEYLKELAELRVGVSLFLDGSDGMEDGGVVSPSEAFADLLEAEACEFACEVHADLSRADDGFLAPGGLEVAESHAVVLDDDIDDPFEGDFWAFLMVWSLKGGAGESECDRLRVGEVLDLYAGEGALELADVRCGAGSDQGGDVVREVNSPQASLLLYNLGSCLVGGESDFHDES